MLYDYAANFHLLYIIFATSESNMQYIGQLQARFWTEIPLLLYFAHIRKSFSRTSFWPITFLVSCRFAWNFLCFCIFMPYIQSNQKIWVSYLFGDRRWGKWTDPCFNGCCQYVGLRALAIINLVHQFCCI